MSRNCCAPIEATDCIWKRRRLRATIDADGFASCELNCAFAVSCNFLPSWLVSQHEVHRHWFYRSRKNYLFYVPRVFELEIYTRTAVAEGFLVMGWFAIIKVKGSLCDRFNFYILGKTSSVKQIHQKCSPSGGDKKKQEYSERRKDWAGRLLFMWSGNS